MTDILGQRYDLLLDLPVRVLNIVGRLNEPCDMWNWHCDIVPRPIVTVADFCLITEAMWVAMPNCGRKTISDIRAALNEFGLAMGDGADRDPAERLPDFKPGSVHYGFKWPSDKWASPVPPIPRAPYDC